MSDHLYYQTAQMFKRLAIDKQRGYGVYDNQTLLVKRVVHMLDIDRCATSGMQCEAVPFLVGASDRNHTKQ